MTRSEIISKFREQNAEFTSRVITDTVANSWLLFGDKDFCAKTRCIVDQDGTTISTSEDDTYVDVVSNIAKFFDIDDYPGSGVLYNNKRLKKTTMAALDEESAGWRDRGSGTPTKWYRRGSRIYFDRPIDSNGEDVIVYAVLISDDWDSNVAPYNELTYLEPYHNGMVLWLKYKAKFKVGKEKDALIAKAEYEDYVKSVKGQLGGDKYSAIHFAPPAGMY